MTRSRTGYGRRPADIRRRAVPAGARMPRRRRRARRRHRLGRRAPRRALSAGRRHGAVLFRGFPLTTAEDFDAFVAAFELPNFPYDESLSNAVRVNRTPRVFTANEAPPSVTIFLHHEMAQTPIYPSQLFFFCEQPAAHGRGDAALPLGRPLGTAGGRARTFARDCEAKGLRYSNVMPAENDPKSGMGRSWQSTLRAATREEAEARLRELGYSWEWLPDGCLRATTPVLPAVRTLPDGRTIVLQPVDRGVPGLEGSATIRRRRSPSATAPRSTATRPQRPPRSARSSRSTSRGSGATWRSSTTSWRCTAGGPSSGTRRSSRR